MLCYTNDRLNREIETGLQSLKSALLDPDDAAIKNLSVTGRLAEIIPEWSRLTGEWNTQHNTHHYLLDDHTFKVIAGTKAATTYQGLSDYQQFLTALAALLHDIDKNTGPLRLRDKIPVDKLHPIKSAELSRSVLTTLGLSPFTIQRIYTLIHHHQAFGRLFIIYRDQNAPPEPLTKIAMKLRSIPLLACLAALSEGDIRGVQEEGAFFTPRVEALLLQYLEQSQQEVHRFRQRLPIFPQTLSVENPGFRLNLAKSAAFVLKAGNGSELYQKLASIGWGGAYMLPYYPQLQALQDERVDCAALIGFLPENMVYLGPEPENTSLSLPMDLFYAVFSGHQSPYYQRLSKAHKMLAASIAEGEDVLQSFLNTFSLENGYSDWQAVSGQIENQGFGPEFADISAHPLIHTCSQNYQTCFLNTPTVGIGTRPVLLGFFSGREHWVPVTGPWEGVPVFHAV